MMGFKRLIVLVAVTILLPSPLWAAHLTEGFSGIKWGTPIETLSNFKEVGSRGEIAYYVNPDVLHTIGRIVCNTTVGIGGLVDVATHEGIPRENEDFGQTLGFYGLGPGPYLVLPVLGPSNLRDTGGLVVDTVVYNWMVRQLIAELGMDDSDEDILYWSLTGLSVIDKRRNESFRYFMTGSPFEYELVRKLSQVRRQFLVEN